MVQAGVRRRVYASNHAVGLWLSHGDAVRMVTAALTAPDPGFAVLYGICAHTRGWWTCPRNGRWAAPRRGRRRAAVVRSGKPLAECPYPGDRREVLRWWPTCPTEVPLTAVTRGIVTCCAGSARELSVRLSPASSWAQPRD